MKRPTSLNAIASGLGISTSTVSRALRRPELVREETRLEIIKAAEEAGYRPGVSASPSRERGAIIAMVVPELENPFFTILVKAAINEARRCGHSLIIADTNEEPLGESEIVAMASRHAGGLIIASSRLINEEIEQIARSIPLVLINRELLGVPSILIDDRSGMAQVIEHLAALGHREIAYVEGPASSWSNLKRRESFEKDTRATGIEGTVLGPYAPRFEGGVQAADVAVARGVTAIVAYNDLMAFGILSRLSNRDISVPGMMSVIGFDDIPSSSIWSPSLTTITASTASIGKSAVQNLIRLLDGKSIRVEANRRLSSNLVVRESTGPAPKS